MKNRQRKKKKEKRIEKNQEIVQNYELISHFMLAFLIYLLKRECVNLIILRFENVREVMLRSLF